jgi:hypothetical protein
MRKPRQPVNENSSKTIRNTFQQWGEVLVNRSFLTVTDYLCFDYPIL